MAATVTRILVPTDLSAGADAALTYGKYLARALGATVHVLHVFSDVYAAASYVPEVYVPLPREVQAEALAAAEAGLAERFTADEARELGGARAVVRGVTATEIVKYAREHGIDLIVMGTHGRRGVAHLLLGSVAEAVVRTAPCPVLTVREQAGPVPKAVAARAATSAYAIV